MCCTLGVQIHLAQLQKIRDAQLRGGIESAAEAVTLSFDPVKIMEIFDRATDSTKAGNNYLETVRSAHARSRAADERSAGRHH